MEIFDLRCFVAVAEELHFSRAAERLHLTTSPLSRRVRELERELGSDLFVRRYHQVELTAFGEEFLPAAGRAIREFDELLPLARRFAPPSGPAPVRVGATPQAPPKMLVALTEAIEKRGQSMSSPVFFEASVALLQKLIDRTIDLAVVHLPVTSPDLACVAVAQYQFGLAMRSDDELAGYESLTLADIAGRDLVLTSSRSHPQANRRLRDLLASLGHDRIIDMPTNDSVIMAANIGTSRRLGLVPANLDMPSSAVFRVPRFTVVPLAHADLGFYVGIAWRKESESGGSVLSETIDDLRRQYSSEPEIV